MQEQIEIEKPEASDMPGLEWPHWSTWPNHDLNIRTLPIYQQLYRIQSRMWISNALEALVKVVTYIREVSGDVVEAGTYKGGCAMALAVASEYFGPLNGIPKRRVYGFDTFEGSPQPSEYDVSDPGRFSDVNFEEVVEAGKEFPNLTFIKGDFSDTLRDFKVSPLGLVLLDCDLYRSYKLCFEYLWPKLSVGGIMLLADWTVHAGADKATNEFLEGRPEKVEDFYGLFGIRKIKEG